MIRRDNQLLVSVIRSKLEEVSTFFKIRYFTHKIANYSQSHSLQAQGKRRALQTSQNLKLQLKIYFLYNFLMIRISLTIYLHQTYNHLNLLFHLRSYLIRVINSFYQIFPHSITKTCSLNLHHKILCHLIQDA